MCRSTCLLNPSFNLYGSFVQSFWFAGTLVSFSCLFIKLLLSQRSYVYTWYSICGIMHICIHFPFLWGQSKAAVLIHWLISVNHYKENDRKIETVTITNSFLVKGSNVVNAIVVKVANIVTTWTKWRKMHQFQLAPLKRRYV